MSDGVGVDLLEALGKAESEADGGAFVRGFEGAVPGAVVDVEGADFDAVRLCIADDLGWLIEAHGLAVDECRGEGGGLVALEPA